MWLCAPVRAAAAEALGSMRDDRARGALLQALFDVDRVVCTCAARSLGSVPDRAAIKALLRVLRDEDPTVGVAAAEGLALAGRDALDGLLEALRDANGHA